MAPAWLTRERSLWLMAGRYSPEHREMVARASERTTKDRDRSRDGCGFAAVGESGRGPSPHRSGRKRGGKRTKPGEGPSRPGSATGGRQTRLFWRLELRPQFHL